MQHALYYPVKFSKEQDSRAQPLVSSVQQVRTIARGYCFVVCPDCMEIQPRGLILRQRNVEEDAIKYRSTGISDILKSLEKL